ncbi:alpha/beta fold hydrolase [Sphingosinicella sp. BN140058]|uniref:alpha/beta fold hydrolase n=1 Tax=Sphingosinicella sp. BN140058 TaxID=1892855 RepID=UPI001010C607|nr:alpha/beta fold hydrolase [Sphingosinicella sp. BN140058]QAY76543.1 alpha/beta fold hydrolase [Sphingosinicella sp. BN140058]
MLAPLILLPGLLCDATLWRAQVQDLADVAAAIVPDLTLDSSIEAMAARVLAAAPPVFALAGLSMGGYVAFEILRQAPARVERLALFSTSAAPDDPARVAARRGGIESLKHGRFIGVTSRLLPQLIHPSRIGSEVGETVTAMAKRVGGAAFLRQQQAILGRSDSRPGLATIRVPTLVAVGDADMLTPPEQSCEINAAVAGSTFHLFEQCGHLPALERPAETSALLRRWLSG